MPYQVHTVLTDNCRGSATLLGSRDGSMAARGKGIGCKQALSALRGLVTIMKAPWRSFRQIRCESDPDQASENADV